MYIADRLYKNATHAKELYGLPCDIPMCLDHHPRNEHIMNAVLLGDNKSDIGNWGFINKKDYLYVFDKNHTKSHKAERLDYIWKNGAWIVLDEEYRLTNYSIGFNVTWLPYEKPIIEIIPTYPVEYQVVSPS